MSSERHLAIRVILLPKDTNAHGTIFGGVILSHIDLAGAVEARRLTCQDFVTVAMKEVEFHEPVFVGDIVAFYTDTVRIGTTSVTVHVEVEASRQKDPTQVVRVTNADITFVAVDKNGKKTPLELSQ